MDFLLVVVAIIIGIAILCAIGKYIDNASSPVIAREACIVSKRISVSGSNISTSTSYYITFELHDSSRLEFIVSTKDYSFLAEGDTGTLCTQGEWFKRFERHFVSRR